MVLTDAPPLGKALTIDRTVSQLKDAGHPVALHVPELPPTPQCVKDCPQCPELVALPSGKFEMGAEPKERNTQQLKRGHWEGNGRFCERKDAALDEPRTEEPKHSK